MFVEKIKIGQVGMALFDGDDWEGEEGKKEEEQVTFIPRALHCLSESSWSNKLPWALLKRPRSWRGFIIECLYWLHVKDQKQMLPLTNKRNNYSTPGTN